LNRYTNYDSQPIIQPLVKSSFRILPDQSTWCRWFLRTHVQLWQKMWEKDDVVETLADPPCHTSKWSAESLKLYRH
jgi:hypothetical protein